MARFMFDQGLGSNKSKNFSLNRVCVSTLRVKTKDKRLNNITDLSG